MTTLTAQALTLSLGTTCVLDRLDASFRRGAITAVLGPNGAGKSSLLACLAGLRRADGGRVLLDGVDRNSLPPRDLAQRIGLLPQNADVHWDVEVATLVALGRYPHRRGWRATPADHAAIARAMASTDITSFATRRMTQLSGGERARVLLARVLAGEPEWLLADEPLASLDPAHQIDALDCLRAAAAGGAGVIVVLHDLNQALYVADSVLLLSRGRSIADGPADAVLTPANIAAAYGVHAQTGTTAEGRRFLVMSRQT